MSALVTAKRIGAAMFDNGKWWFLSGGAFNGSATTAPTSGTDNGWLYSGRGAVFPINRDGMLFELGGSLAYQAPNSAGTYSSENTLPEENTVGTDLVQTGAITGVTGVVTEGLEAAAQYHQFLIEGEWFGQEVRHTATRAAPTNAFFSGWYAQAAWTITGESHPWLASQAVFGGIKPRHPFDPFGAGGWGAWELAARYSVVNLTDVRGLGAPSSTIPMGKEADTTVALNWYLNTHLRAELDWTHILPLTVPTSYKGNLNGLTGDIIELRGQLNW